MQTAGGSHNARVRARLHRTRRCETAAAAAGAGGAAGPPQYWSRRHLTDPSTVGLDGGTNVERVGGGMCTPPLAAHTQSAQTAVSHVQVVRTTKWHAHTRAERSQINSPVLSRKPPAVNASRTASPRVLLPRLRLSRPLQAASAAPSRAALRSLSVWLQQTSSFNVTFTSRAAASNSTSCSDEMAAAAAAQRVCRRRLQAATRCDTLQHRSSGGVHVHHPLVCVASAPLA
jgi:hypothetical protein